jgi:hypothetical protein|tara:strand:- start:614 stop:814 length:201 start_codon:yes stop_codon:yes gene_type:complete
MLLKFIGAFLISTMLYIPADKHPTTGFWRLDRMHKIEKRRMDRKNRKEERQRRQEKPRVEKATVQS